MWHILSSDLANVTPQKLKVVGNSKSSLFCMISLMEQLHIDTLSMFIKLRVVRLIIDLNNLQTVCKSKSLVIKQK